jgi:hypothetical protein
VTDIRRNEGRTKLGSSTTHSYTFAKQKQTNDMEGNRNSFFSSSRKKAKDVFPEKNAHRQKENA